MANERHTAAFVVGAVLGGGAGFAVAWLRAPQSGAASRVKLAEAADGLAASVRGLPDRLGAEVNRLLDRLNPVPGGPKSPPPDLLGDVLPPAGAAGRGNGLTPTAPPAATAPVDVVIDQRPVPAEG